MYEYQWRPFGVPATISSDQGSHFISSWWDTLCHLMGIRQAYSQAYHHQAIGRAERAGQQIMEKLRKLQVHDKVNWVETLPRVLDRIHDLPGETGFTPSEILFGRHRPLSGLPLPIPHVCEDALQFFLTACKLSTRKLPLPLMKPIGNLRKESIKTELSLCLFRFQTS